jgi:cytochrome bd-type quinol oxidase subunit 2
MGAKRFFLWFFVLPCAIAFAIIGAANVAGIKEGYPSWLQVVFTILSVPIAVNLFFGPMIYATWQRKKSRLAIAIVNILFSCLILTFGSLALPNVATLALLLWIWALASKVEAPKGTPPLTPPVAS